MSFRAWDKNWKCLVEHAPLNSYHLGHGRMLKRITVVLTKISGTNGLLPKITGGLLIAGKY